MIDIIDHKGEHWQLTYIKAAQKYLHKGEAYWKAWWYATKRPHEFRNYATIPLPIFTDWWPHEFGK